MLSYKGYEAVVGVEVHVELRTAEKAFCRCSARFGDVPNANVCPVCLGMPGATPSLNGDAVRLALRAGLALGCDISGVSRFDRKHYFYPDLPKGYQITQFYDPLCRNGEVAFELDGAGKSVGIERIHLEEDAGKLSYKDGILFIDNNRCGVPLVEIVTYPHMRSGEETMAFVEELRRILLFADVSDCKMNEGSLRCDVNVSVRPVGSDVLGNRCEIKNINSVNFIGRAVDSELVRQTELILAGGEVHTETRRFNEDTCQTEYMREKEMAADYRYIREPEIPSIFVDEDYIEAERVKMPPLPAEREEKLRSLGIKAEAVGVICHSPVYADYFDSVSSLTTDAVTAANLFVSEVVPAMKKGDPYPSFEYLAECADMYAEGDVNIVSARASLKLSLEEGVSPRKAAETHGLFMLKDEGVLLEMISSVCMDNEKTVTQIRAGKDSAKKVIVGGVMKLSGGRAEPRLLSKLVDKYFE